MFLLALTYSAAHAETYEYLVFTTSAGDIAMKAEGMKMTFSDGCLVAANGDETRSFALSDLSKFCFSNETTGVKTVSAGQGTEIVDVYTLSGQKLGRFPYGAGAVLPLPQGTYIVRSDGTAKTIVVK